MAQGLQGEAIVFIKLINTAKGERKDHLSGMKPCSFRLEIKAMIFKSSVDCSSQDGLIFQPYCYSSENNVVPSQELRPTACRSDSSELVCYQTLPMAGFSTPVIRPVTSLFSTRNK